MTLEAPLLSVYSIVKLALATWLFSYTLPRRKPARLRAALVLVAVAGLSAASVLAGFSVFPTLTDDLSFVTAILTFVGVLAAMVVAQECVWECSLWTSVFCCSMAYLLENLSNAFDRAAGSIFPQTSYPTPLLEGSVRYWLISAVVFVAVYLLLIRRIEKTGLLLISDPVMVVVAALTIVVCMVLDLTIKDLAMFDIPRRYQEVLNWGYLIVSIYLMYSAFEVIYTRRLQLDVAAAERLRAAEARQYEMSRENIEAINVKCHDIRHQIRQLADGGAVVDRRALDDISREVDVYDSAVRTGCDALDTILSEKGLVCQRRGITLSCIADGPAVGFMAPSDLYSLFGNALDNAIEAVEALADPERRSVSLVVRRADDLVSIHVENYFDGQASFGEDGLPLTRKADKGSHGFGVRSMRMIVESYGGTLTMSAQDDVFHLNALIPAETA